MVDYLIVGCGLAGIAFAETALQNRKSIVVFDNNSQQSSRVAGGLYNPVILKRFSEVWNAQEQITLLNSFYGSLEKKLNSKFDFKIPIYRKLFSIEEQNNWFQATDKIGLAPFLSTKLISKKYNGIDSPYNFGEVLQTGYVDTDALLTAYHNYLNSQGFLSEEAFDYEALLVEEDFIQYKSIKAKHIIFAEGFGMISNPYFGHLPLDGTKGELLIIKASDLKLNVVVKTSVFILPLGNDLYKVGATYNWKDKSNLPTEEGKQELLENLKEILHCDFEIIEHLAGVRPTVKDRRPMVGTHPKHKCIHLLNGLGTRGVMLAPAMARDLFENIEEGKPLDMAIDIKRFKKAQW